MKKCGFTGHRVVPDDKTEYVRRELRHEIEQAIADGFTYFISGFAQGADLIFAAIMVEIKRDNPAIVLEAAIPFKDRVKTPDPLFHELLEQCGHVHYAMKKYAPNAYYERNKYIAENAERLIAVFDGRERSGTAQTIKLAEALGRDLKVIRIDQ